MSRLSKTLIHYYIHLFVLCLFAVGIVCSKFLMSMGILLGLLNLIIEGDFKQYFSNLKSNRFFIAVFAFYVLHILGLLWTNDIISGLDDLKSKATIVVLPLIVIARPIVLRKSYKFLIIVFLLGLLITSVINFTVYHFFESSFDFKDARDMSLFNSHIRYAIMIAFTLPLLYDLYKDSKGLRFILILMGIWFLFYTFSSQVLTGILSIVAIVIALVVYPLLKNKKYIPFLFLICSGLVTCSFIYVGLKSNVRYDKPPKVNIPSVMLAWEKKSNIPYDGKDKRSQDLKYTLARFLSSKAYPNSGIGVGQLSSAEVHAIEQGMAHISEMQGGFKGRIEGLRYQLSHMSDPNGHSLLQRFEAWKVGWSIYLDNPIKGVGTGDLNSAFKDKYQSLDSKLTIKNQIRAHNTFLTSAITFGILGVICFFYLLFISVKIQLRYENLSGFVFWTIMFVTFFFEDTLETQTGVTLFAFFLALFSLPIPRPSME